MELSAEQLEAIKQASRDIDFGRITVSFSGGPVNFVDIAVEKRTRFHNQKAQPSLGEPLDRQQSGRMG